MTATALDMRYRTHDLLASLSRGVQVVITYRGKKAGLILPYSEGRSPKCGHVRNHPFFASAVDGGVSVEEAVDKLCGGRFDDI